MAMTDDEKWLTELLAGRMKRDEKVAEIIRYFESDVSYVAYARNRHVPIETVEIYGLEINVDANGCASEVHFPDGYVTE
jgi:hypothetical protein